MLVSRIRRYFIDNGFNVSKKDIQLFETLDNEDQKLVIIDIQDHKKGICVCDLTDDRKGLCFAGQWLENCISTKDFISKYKDLQQRS